MEDQKEKDYTIRKDSENCFSLIKANQIVIQLSKKEAVEQLGDMLIGVVNPTKKQMIEIAVDTLIKLKNDKPAAIIGRKGGLARTEIKIAAVKENGKKGGRRKKYTILEKSDLQKINKS